MRATWNAGAGVSEPKAFDAGVIGDGLAGFAAALTLRRGGKRVAIFTRGSGATSVSSGLWDFGPVAEAGSFSSACEKWRGYFSDLQMEGGLPIVAAQWMAGSEEVIEALSPHLEITRRWEMPYLLPSLSGQLRSGYVAQGIQSRADLQTGGIRRVSVLGSRRWRFRGDLLSRQWNEAAKRRGLSVEFRALDLPLEGEAWDIPLPRVAADLAARPAEVERLREAVARIAESSDSLLFPPIFPSDAIFRTISGDGKFPVAEALSWTEPVAGFRLNGAIRAALALQEVERFPTQQIKVQTGAGTVRELTALGQSGWTTLRAATFVLASGRYFGGGLSAGTQRTVESIFALPLHGTGDAMGVRVDASFRPLAEDGRPAFQNLHACGSILGGLDYAGVGVGLGFFALSGRQSVASAL